MRGMLRIKGQEKNSKKEEIGKTIDIVERETRKFREPSVTEISRKRDPYQVLVSCIISLRTRDETTRKVSQNLFQKAYNAFLEPAFYPAQPMIDKFDSSSQLHLLPHERDPRELVSR